MTVLKQIYMALERLPIGWTSRLRLGVLSVSRVISVDSFRLAGCIYST